MSKFGRNESCPCGSNKKYKKCCQAKDQLAERVMITSGGFVAEDYNLDHDSNRIVDLINEGRLDEAEESAKKLLIEYPEVIDGFDRLAMIYEKRCSYIMAIDMYQKALDSTLDQDGFDEEGRDYYRRKIAQLNNRVC